MEEDDYEISVDSPPPQLGDNDESSTTTGSRLIGATGGYAWEEEYKRSWDVLQEDEHGSIEASVTNLTSQLKRKRLLRDTRLIQRGLVRHLVIIVDMSFASRDVDYKPNRIELIAQLLDTFLIEFFDQNPLALISFVVTHNEKAHLLTPLSSHPGDHLGKIRQRYHQLLSQDIDPGEPSLQNSLNIARGLLIHVPSHGTREVLFITSALTTCDPGDIRGSIDTLKPVFIRVSVVSLSAEMRILRILTSETRGSFAVAMNESHLKELILEHVPPPAIILKSMARNTSKLMRMGFPQYQTAESYSLCACHNCPSLAGFECPQCHSKVCAVPSECVVCGLTLVLSPHLARSYHHLFPIPNFDEITDWNEVHSNECNACMGPLPTKPTTGEISMTIISTRPTGRYACPRCKSQVCLDCDVYIHDVLHNCPMCSTTPNDTGSTDV